MRRALGCLVVGVVVLSGCGDGGSAIHANGDAALAKARLAALTGPAVTVVAVGDIACPAGRSATAKTCRQGATAKAAAALSPQRVIALGDEQYQKGSYYGFTHSYAKSWGRLRSITYPVVGNHEYYTTGARGYFRYFRYRQPGSPGWYRRSLNGWQLYFLNSNCGKVNCAAERAWLERAMTAHPSTCSLIAMHHPRFSSGGEHGSSLAMKPFWQIAYRHHADIALAGHDHDYERFSPMSPDGVVEPTRGIQEFVSGAGGKSLYPKGTIVAGSRVFLNTTFGVLKLRLTPTGYGWQFRDINLHVRDSGSASCR
jgi:hypothetical protein